MNSLHSIDHTQTLCFLLSQYELLERTAHHLSALDLFNLALTCHELHSVILESPPLFNKLRRLTICSGQGLTKRQTVTGLYNPHYNTFGNSHTFGPSFDEEIEVRLFNIKCDTYNALPCLKCKINICEVYTYTLHTIVKFLLKIGLSRSVDTSHAFEIHHTTNPAADPISTPHTKAKR
jgi:hypothetical protein